MVAIYTHFAYDRHDACFVDHLPKDTERVFSVMRTACELIVLFGDKKQEEEQMDGISG